jgi:uncharacterized repeat protein (TIGR01451 family)
MKKLLLSFFAILMFGITYSQTQLTSITPNTLGVGQTNIVTTITGVNLNFAGASPAGVRLIGPATLGGRQKTFLSNNVLTANFTVPNLPHFIGTYDLNYIVYDSLTSTYRNCSLPNAVTISSTSPTVSGFIYHDANQNGIKDIGENPIANQYVVLNPTNVYAYSNSQGNYAFFVQPGSYTINYPTSGANYALSAGSPSSYNVTVTNASSGNNFGVHSTYYDFNTTCYNYHWLRCFDSTYHYLSVTNRSNISYSGHLDYILQSNMNYVSSSFPLTVIGDTLRWPFTINAISTVDFFNSLKIANPGPGLPISAQLNVYANVNGTDSLVATSSYASWTTCSYDPNDKSVQPPGAGSQNYTLFTDELQYRIRFQNTGTDTAYHVVVRDTLDSDLDLNTFRILGSSHTVNTELMPNGLVKFTFLYIMLPDSNVDESASHGFVSYAIKAKTGLAENTFIDNTAYIYFDYNDAVITNTTNNTMVSVIPTGISDIYNDGGGLSIMPNPANNFSQVNFNNDSHSELTLSVFNLLGEVVFKTEKVTTGKVIINTANLNEGIYLVRVTDNFKTNYSGKLEVLKK